MLRGPWPRTTTDGVSLPDLEARVEAGTAERSELDATADRLVGEALAAQEAAGCGLLTDGQVRWEDPAKAHLVAVTRNDTGPDGLLLRTWRAAAALTSHPVAQAVTGPWTLALREVGAWGDLGVISGQAYAHAEVLAGELRLLAEAGCPVAIVEEPAAVSIGENVKMRAGFVRAHRRLLADAPELHAMLSITGGSAHAAGPETIFGASYRSHLFDLIAGPDNWYLVRQAPGERGIICAALVAVPGRTGIDQAPVLVWAAQYAASANGRGLDRIGLANASPMAALTPAEASTALAELARAASFATMPLKDAIAAGLDPKALEVMPRFADPA